MDGVDGNRGVNYRALQQLFDLQAERADEYSYEFYVSMKEIYNENIRDLLDESGSEKDLKIRQNATGMYVEGLTENRVYTVEDVYASLDRGKKNRVTGVTNMNEHSSRSHSVLSVRVVGHNRAINIQYNGKLHLIDLAGSERVGKSGATGQQMKEAQAINKSLSALGDVIQALQQKAAHIPYRNSKLTVSQHDADRHSCRHICVTYGLLTP